jgi:hypothetical protein
VAARADPPRQWPAALVARVRQLSRDGRLQDARRVGESVCCVSSLNIVAACSPRSRFFVRAALRRAPRDEAARAALRRRRRLARASRPSVAFHVPPFASVSPTGDPALRVAFVDASQTRGTGDEGRSAPTPKMEAPSAAIDGKLYVFGGFAGTTYGAPSSRW